MQCVRWRLACQIIMRRNSLEYSYICDEAHWGKDLVRQKADCIMARMVLCRGSDADADMIRNL